MSKIVFRDFDEFADAINGVSGRFIPTARSERDWWVQVMPVGRVAMQQVMIGGASTFAGDGKDNAITIGIPVTSAQRVRIDGSSLDDNSFILVKEGQPFTFAAKQTVLWAGVTVPLDHPSLSPELLDSLNSRSARSHSATHIRTQLPYITNARLLVTRICAQDGIGLLDPVAARAAEEEITMLAAHAIEASSRLSGTRVGRPQLPRDRVIAKALEVVEANRGEPLFIEDLCKAAHVSERTLRNVFQEYFGVGPMRLLKVRQLREIRSALMSASADGQTVASIAARFGVWDFSLFARNYKSLFGETPMQTLRSRQQQRRRDNPLNPTWMRFASRKFMDSVYTASP